MRCTQFDRPIQATGHQNAHEMPKVSNRNAARPFSVPFQKELRILEIIGCGITSVRECVYPSPRF
jgi:hypothetical protein